MSLFQSIDTGEAVASPLFRALTASLIIHFCLLMFSQYGTFTAEHSNSTQDRPWVARLNARLQKPLPASNETHHRESLEAATHTPSAQVAEVARREGLVPPSTTESKSEDSGGMHVSALYYYTLDEVQQRPLMVRPPPIEETIPDTNIVLDGVARIELLLERTGQINAVNIISTDLPPPYTQLLRQAFLQMEYTPGKIEGQAVRTRIHIEVAYTNGILSSPSETKQNNAVLLQRLPHTPITLPADRHQRKQNPARKAQ